MRRLADIYRRGGRRARACALPAALLAAFLVAGPAAVAPAQEPTEAPAAAAAPEPAELAAAIEERYRVLPTVGGLLLEPRDEVPGIQTVEIAGGEVAINGEPVAPTILTSWLGDEAAPLLELAALPEEEARSLFAEEGAEDGEEADGEALLDEAGEPAAPDAPEAPATAREPRDPSLVYLGERVIFGRNLTIDENEVAGEVVVIGGAAHIEGRVDGGVVAIGGPVILAGDVRGDVVSVGGSVEAGPDASIGGDVVTVGGTVQLRDEQIGGDVVQIGFTWWPGDWGWSPGWEGRSTLRAWAAREAIGNVAAIALLALLTAFLLLVARGPVERAAQVIARQPGSALLSGFAMWVFQIFGILIVLVLLVATIVGCLAVPFVPFLWFFGWLLYLPGYAAAALQVGRWVRGRFGWGGHGAYGTALLGVLAIESVKLVGNVLAIAGSWIGFFASLVEWAGLM
ncbi:MAG TPA: hypothetical protein VHM02_07345, partial [Thermoanaerobaculia bacterium]|nr:hypothetical protein [Thermoanaerobaculia bacterium]